MTAAAAYRQTPAWTGAAAMHISDQSPELNLTENLKKMTVTRNGGGLAVSGSGTVITEHFVDVYINEELAVRLVCTPQYIKEMVVGRLLSDGYIRETEEIRMLYICEHASRVRVFLHGKTDLKESVSREPTCCTGNQVFRELFREREPQILERAFWKPEWIFAMADEFAAGGSLHAKTKGTHSCYLSVKGRVVFSCEDIGRHNALDKAIGYAALSHYDRSDCILYTTGRVPTDMVKKAIVAGIPVLVSKSSPTEAAVELACRYRLTLICNAWPDRYDIFCAPENE
ncbi:MAG: formate dehydrogenase accessory sulfurtransferase FdhD [Clostridiales bacterium]|nr:formate dehydrogenase accessory sulfurtransferase FdhD [Clostridiales bacterium]